MNKERAAIAQPAEPRLMTCPGCGMEFADELLHDANLKLWKAAQADAQPLAPGGTWEDNATRLLERCPHTVWQRPGAGPVDLLASLVVTFMGMQQKLAAAPPARQPQPLTDEQHHGLDTDERVCFYEQDFYVLSNFSSFNLQWKGLTFPTSEHAYHYMKFAKPWSAGEKIDFSCPAVLIAQAIFGAPSAHEAFKLAEQYKSERRPDWDSIKVGVMRDILRAKAMQHSYVQRKLLATGDRELVENSWRDGFWGWGPNRDGQNMLGKLWMEIRHELRAHGIGREGEKP